MLISKVEKTRFNFLLNVYKLQPNNRHFLFFYDIIKQFKYRNKKINDKRQYPRIV